jgi:hypothetical protein
MVQRELALICTALVLLCQPGWASQSSSEPSGAKHTSMKERFMLISAGSTIEFKLSNNQKIRGRLGAISDSGFELQHTRDNQVVSESLAFETVKSVKRGCCSGRNHPVHRGAGMQWLTNVI